MKSDPLGQAIFDYWKDSSRSYPSVEVFMNGEPMQEMPAELFFRNSRQLRHYERLALKSCIGPVLDVGAASGIHSLWLQERRVEVTAIDFSELCCEVMKLRGLKDVVHSDIFKFQPKKKYSTILLLMNGTGIAGELSKMPSLLKVLKKMLAPGGQILVDSSDILYYYRGRLLPLHAYYGDVSFKMVYGKIESDSFPWTFVDPETLNREAEKANLKCTVLHTDQGGHYLARLY